ncbi:MAG: aminoglycoside phosphotransferase family protein [Candidatus Pacebacteria bacterium]|jgi:aminoglycoside phosphotransferase (APT) family kinase protein|nr:aminoglycoside phosphotransferase family protein [Candidatus Paceibacterota bacterium]
MIESHNIANLEGNSVENAVKSDFGFDIKDAEKITKGYQSQVYKANLENDVVFIRINKDPNVFEVEQLAYKIFEDKGIPVPKIIAYKEKPVSIGQPTVIMTSAVGKTIGEAKPSQEQNDIIYEQLGEILRKINETKLEGFGKLEVKNNTLIGKFSNWKQYCESENERHHKALDFCSGNNFVTNEEANKIRNLYKEIESLNFGKASLLHKDIHQGHFFVQGSDVTGIIDLGSIMAGDPRYDIAMSLVFQNPRQQEHFKKGYNNDLANDPMVNKYMITIIIRKLYFRSKQEIKGNVDVLLSPLKSSLGKLS